MEIGYATAMIHGENAGLITNVKLFAVDKVSISFEFFRLILWL